MKKNAVVIGYSGHAYVVLDILLSTDYIIRGYCEAGEKKKNPYRIDYLGSEKNVEVLSSIKMDEFFIGVGDNKIRRAIAEFLFDKECCLPNLIHPSAIISPVASMDSANVVMPGVVINSLARLGKGIICNTSCIVEHECTIGDYVHIAPGAVLAGNVSIGNNTFVGANSVVRQGIRIGNNVTIGAGAVITKDIENGHTVIGNPGRYLRN